MDIFDLSFLYGGLCNIKIEKFVIVITELSQNRLTHVFEDPALPLKKLCIKKDLNICEILCICYMGNKSYSGLMNYYSKGSLDVYRICKLDDYGKINFCFSKITANSELINSIFERAKDKDITLEKLEKEFNLF